MRRELIQGYSSQHGYYAHFHDGQVCSGYPTIEECANYAISCSKIGMIVEREDYTEDGIEVKCYSFVSAGEQHLNTGKYVAELKIVSVPIK